MQIRRFSPDLKTKTPGGHPGLYGVPILLNSTMIPPDRLEILARRAHGLPLMHEANLHVVALYFDPHASMDEHSADHPILFLIINGQGSMRLGGPEGETRAVQAGDAVLWPAHLDHTVWTDDEALAAIAIEFEQEN